MKSKVESGMLLIILCGGACISGSDFIAVIALLTAMLTIRKALLGVSPLVHCDSDLNVLSKGFLIERRYTAVGFNTEFNTRSYTCLFDISLMGVFCFFACCIISLTVPFSEYEQGMIFYVVLNFLVSLCFLFWYSFRCNYFYGKKDGYCIILSILISAVMHCLSYYSCIKVKLCITDLDLIVVSAMALLLVLLLYLIIYYPDAIRKDSLFSIFFGAEDDEVRITTGDAVYSSLACPFIPVILPNGDLRIHYVGTGAKKQDKVLRAEDVTEFKHVDTKFQFYPSVQRWQIVPLCDSSEVRNGS